MRKLATLFGCLLSVVIFGGIGAGAAWVLATSIRDAREARDWVKTRAEVVFPDTTISNSKPAVKGRGTGIYRYKMGEQEYTGSRLGVMTVGGADPFGDWSEAMQEFVDSAFKEKRTITVSVNPDNPAVALIDSGMPWGMLSFLAPFALVFGLIGIASLYGFFRVLFAPLESMSASTTETHPAAMWIFVIIWNVISFPVAGSTIPGFVADGDWPAWLILFFPIIGVLLAWAGFRHAIKYHTLRWARPR